MDSSPVEQKVEKKDEPKADMLNKMLELLNKYKYIIVFVILAIALYVYKNNYKQEILSEPFSGTE